MLLTDKLRKALCKANGIWKVPHRDFVFGWIKHYMQKQHDVMKKIKVFGI